MPSPSSVSAPHSLITSYALSTDENYLLLPASFQSDTTYCNLDEAFTQSIVDVISGATHCSYITQADLAELSDSLELNGTAITGLGVPITQDLSGLSILRLNTNNLTAIPADQLLPILADLTELYLHENEIASVGANAFENMSSLIRLTLRDNKLSAVPANLYSNLASLERLYLYNNQISSIAVAAFADLPKLERLRLYNNSISELVLGVFDDLNVTEINLSNNELSSLPLNLLQNHKAPSNITTFNIADNPLTDPSDTENYNANGWAITDVSWQSTDNEFEYELQIGHALPGNLAVPFTVVNGTVDGATSGEVTITAGETTAGAITLVPTSNTQPYSLTSNLTKVAAFSGHIGSATLQTDSTYCGSDPNFTDSYLTAEIAGVTHCSFITKADLAGLE